jgi:hypothetical protein
MATQLESANAEIERLQGRIAELERQVVARADAVPMLAWAARRTGSSNS